MLCSELKPIALCRYALAFQGTAVFFFFLTLGATNLTHEASRAAPYSSWGILLFSALSSSFAFPLLQIAV